MKDLLGLLLSYPFFWQLPELDIFWGRFHDEVEKRRTRTKSRLFGLEEDNIYVTGQESEWYRKGGMQDVKTYLQAILLNYRTRRVHENIGNHTELSLDEEEDAELDTHLWGLLVAVRNIKSHTKPDHESLSLLNPELKKQVICTINDTIYNNPIDPATLSAITSVSYWNKIFPRFSLFTYFAAHKRNNPELNKLYFPTVHGNTRPPVPNPTPIPKTFPGYIEQVWNLIDQELKMPTALYTHSYNDEQKPDRTLAFFKRPPNTLNRDMSTNVLFYVDGDAGKVQVFRSDKSRTQITVQNGTRVPMIESSEDMPGDLPKSFAIIMTDDIAYSLLEFQELKKGSPISIFVFTTDHCSYKSIQKKIEKFSQLQCTMKLIPREILWQELSPELQERTEVFLCDQKHSPCKIKLNDISNDANDRIYNELEGEFILSLIHKERRCIFRSCLPSLPAYYHQRSLQTDEDTQMRFEDDWLKEFKDGKITSPAIITDDIDSGKVCLLSHIGIQLIKDRYIVKYISLKDILPKLSKTSDLKEIFLGLWADSKFVADLACSYLKASAFKFAILIRVSDDISQDEKQKAVDVLKNIMTVIGNPSWVKTILLIISCRPSFNITDNERETVWKLDRLDGDEDQVDFFMRHWQEALELEEVEVDRLKSLAQQCVNAHRSESSLLQLPRYCSLIADAYMENAREANTKFVQYDLPSLYGKLVHSKFSNYICQHAQKFVNVNHEINSSHVVKDSPLFQDIFRIIDLSHQIKAVKMMIGENSKLLDSYEFDIIKNCNFIKYGQLLNDGRVNNYFCAKFVMSFITEKLHPLPIQILKDILSLNTSKGGFRHDLCVELLEQLLAKTGIKNIATKYCIVEMAHEAHWIHYFLLEAIKKKLENLYVTILLGIEGSGKKNEILKNNPFKARAFGNDLVEQYHTSVIKKQFIVKQYIVEVIKIDVNSKGEHAVASLALGYPPAAHQKF